MASILATIGAGAAFVWAALKEYVIPKLLALMIGIAAFTLIGAMLPNDPFRSVIQSWASVIHPYIGLINYFFPMGYILGSTIFFVCFYVVFFAVKVYASVMDVKWLCSILDLNGR